MDTDSILVHVADTTIEIGAKDGAITRHVGMEYKGEPNLGGKYIINACGKNIYINPAEGKVEIR